MDAVGQLALGKTGIEFGKGSPLGLLFILILVISVLLLVMSMNKHLKKVRKNFGDIPANSSLQTSASSEQESSPSAADNVSSRELEVECADERKNPDKRL